MKLYCLRKLTAFASSLAIAIMLAVTTMPAAASADSTVHFSVDKTAVAAGDLLKLSVEVDNVPAEGWNILEFAISYNENQLELVTWYAEYAMDADHQVTEVDTELNPIKGASFSTEGQKLNGKYLTVLFQVKDNVKAGDKLTITNTLNTFAKYVIDNNQFMEITDLAQPETTKIELTVKSKSNTSMLSFTTDKTIIQPGDTVKLSVNVDNIPNAGWNLLEFNIIYDADQLQPIMVKNEAGNEKEWLPGPAMDRDDQFTQVNFNVNPITGYSMSIDGQKLNGEYLSILFKVKDGVKNGEAVKITGLVKQLVQTIIIDDKELSPIDLVQPNSSQGIELLVQPKTLESIALTTMPARLTYLEGKDTLDVAGGKLTLTYNNGDTEDVALTADMVTGFDNTVFGDQTLTVTYQGKEASFHIKVVRLGDINEDDEISAADALLALQTATGKITLTGISLEAANVDGKDSISANDALFILQFATQKINSFPAQGE